MSAPRVEIRLDLLRHNASQLVNALSARGIGVPAITKATLGSPEVAQVLLDAGVTGLGESRIENVERLRAAKVTAPITFVRSPMVSQAERVVAHTVTLPHDPGRQQRPSRPHRRSFDRGPERGRRDPVRRRLLRAPSGQDVPLRHPLLPERRTRRAEVT